jgi:hypothetical protein
MPKLITDLPLKISHPTITQIAPLDEVWSGSNGSKNAA